MFADPAAARRPKKIFPACEGEKFSPAARLLAPLRGGGGIWQKISNVGGEGKGVVFVYYATLITKYSKASLRVHRGNYINTYDQMKPYCSTIMQHTHILMERFFKDKYTYKGRTGTGKDK
jgi:hypothetical protein